MAFEPMEDIGMARKRHKAEEIVSKLRQVDVLTSQGRPVAEAVRSIGVTEVTYYRWRSEYGGLKGDQARREGLKVPQKQPKKGRLWLNDENGSIAERAIHNHYSNVYIGSSAAA
jgi:Transposase